MSIIVKNRIYPYGTVLFRNPLVDDEPVEPVPPPEPGGTEWFDSFPVLENEYSLGYTPRGVYVMADGTKMWVSDFTNKLLREYILGTPFNVSTATLNYSLDVSSLDTIVNSLYVKSNGKKIYFVGDNTNTIYAYNLSTQFSLASATYAGENFNTSGQDSGPRSLYFKPDGTRMYVGGYSTYTIREYHLSTPWNISTATYYTFKYLAIFPAGIFLKNDGTRLFVIDESFSNLRQYDLSTPWDISSTDTGNARNTLFHLIDNVPGDIHFGYGGSRMFACGDANKKVYGFKLNNYWITSKIKATGASFSVSSQDGSPRAIFYKPDGTRMYMAGVANNRIYQYHLSTPWNTGTSSYTGNSRYVGTHESTVDSIYFRSDGAYIYFSGISADRVQQYSNAVAWDINSGSNIGFKSISAQDTTPRGISFRTDGTKMYVLGDTNDRVFEYNLSSAWDVTTATYTGSSYLLPTGLNYYDLVFRPDGTEFYALDQSNNRILKFKMSTPWSVATATYTKQAYEFGVGLLSSFHFSPSGDYLSILDMSGKNIHDFSVY